ncbi:hypothetical protein J5N97_030046 [Dioscorea zingiberensis]|uniref:DUF4378 domain-containing protein n=1 Tax=Dioscorea zingiberensis TaxID=325984 RepID=A0A9D5BWW2_9LILI|nr:hypothetical protein J5N97_030046 [Dioscorea zingiberensis]
MGRRDWYWSRSADQKGSPGCMSGMLHFLDFHQLLFTTTNGSNPKSNTSKTPPELSPQPSNLKGLEAPRNSLELNEEEIVLIKEEYCDVPVGVQINQVPATLVTKREMGYCLEEERKSSSSQAGTPRTPSVVARLMGLEMLPEREEAPAVFSLRSMSTCSISPPAPLTRVITKKKKKKNIKHYDDDCPKHSPHSPKPLQNWNSNINGSQSLPDTPRASSPRKSWDVDSRYSTQLNKENHNPDLEPEFGSRLEGENKTHRSNNHYAREIVKQVKESIINNRRDSTLAIASDEFGIKSRRTRPCDRSHKSSKSSTPPSSPPHSIASKSSTSLDHTVKLLRPVKPTRPPPPPPSHRLDTKPSVESNKCEKKDGYEHFTKGVKKRSSTQKTQARLDDVLQPSTPSPQTERCKHKETQTIHKTLAARQHQDFELEYVRSVLEHANLMSPLATSFKMHCNYNPLDPIIFQRLELKLPPDSHSTGPLRHRWNRKLLFHLVNEIIGEHVQSRHLRTGGEPMLNSIWMQISSYPAANCQFLGDIDALVNADLPERNLRRLLLHPAVEEEAVSIVLEIEWEIVEELVGEMLLT